MRYIGLVVKVRSGLTLFTLPFIFARAYTRTHTHTVPHSVTHTHTHTHAQPHTQSHTRARTDTHTYLIISVLFPTVPSL